MAASQVDQRLLVIHFQQLQNERIQDNATCENPMALPTGSDYALVNGQLVVDRGKHTGARPGKVLRGPGYRAP